MSFQSFLNVGATIDLTLFRFINGQLYQQWLAELTYLFARDKIILIFLMAAALVYLWWRGWRQVLVLVSWSGLAIISANLLHNHLLKPFFNRPRPFISLEDVHLSAALRDLSMVSLSFPSTHAASSAAMAMIIIKLDPACRWPAVAFAALIGFFTIYSGGHYPFDVCAGYLVGGSLGWGLMRVKRLIWPREQLFGQG